jgi:4'-phosphopantetheinyl transferase
VNNQHVVSNSFKPHIAIIRYGFISELISYSLFDLLSAEEKERSKKFRYKKDYNLFIASRACLRKLLACYLNCKPKDLKIQYSLNGKPYLEGINEVQFNVSHSNDAFLLGLTKNKAIGVDIEHLNRKCDIKSITRLTSNANETKNIFTLKEADSRKTFINSWTRKEAIVKAMGYRMSYSFDQLELPLPPMRKNENLSENILGADNNEWFLDSLKIPGNYHATIAVRGKIKSLDIKNISTDSTMLF